MNLLAVAAARYERHSFLGAVGDSSVGDPSQNTRKTNRWHQCLIEKITVELITFIGSHVMSDLCSIVFVVLVVDKLSDGSTRNK